MTTQERAALVLIEFQREWLDETGKINHLVQDRTQFHTAVAGGERALAAARRHGLPVVHVGLRFTEGHPELGVASGGLRAAIKRVGSFPVAGSGSEIPPPFTPRPGEFVVTGRTGASGFAGSNLDSYLRNNRIDHLYLAGFALHVCVESTLRAGHDLGYTVTVVEDATTAFTAEQRAHVLDHVVHHFGDRVTADEFEKRLAG